MRTASKLAANQATVGGRDTSSRNRYTRVLHALKAGPMHREDLAVATDIPYTELHSLLGRMCNEKVIVVIGTAGQMGMTGVRGDAKVFALAGTEKLPVPSSGAELSRRASKSDSGQVAGPIVIGRRMMRPWGRGGSW